MSEPLTAPINKILPYSVVDGPGNRVAIFFQRCNIHCAYCHNPETQNLCRNCGACVEECPGQALRMVNGQVCWAAEKCLGCDRCIQVCPNRASPKVTEMTPEQVFERICESLPFIRGITVSGGECSLYPEFLEKLFLLTREKHLTALMDCNGTIDLSRYPRLMTLCDGVCHSRAAASWTVREGWRPPGGSADPPADRPDTHSNQSSNCRTAR